MNHKSNAKKYGLHAVIMAMTMTLFCLDHGMIMARFWQDSHVFPTRELRWIDFEEIEDIFSPNESFMKMRRSKLSC